MEKLVLLGKSWDTLGNKGNTWKNGAPLEKVSHLKKWLTLGKMGDTLEKELLLEKWVTLGKIGHILKIG